MAFELFFQPARSSNKFVVCESCSRALHSVPRAQTFSGTCNQTNNGAMKHQQANKNAKRMAHCDTTYTAAWKAEATIAVASGDP
jgi:hypothetical protein